MAVETRAASGGATQGAFLSSVAHDLRNRLNAIAIRVALGREPSIEDDKRMEQLEVIDRLLANVRSFIDELSELAALEDGRLPLEIVRCDARDLVSRALRGAEARMNTSDHAPIDCKIGDDLPPVRADETRAVQLACNLVAELVPRVPEGTTVSIVAEVTGEHLRVTIAAPPMQGMRLPGSGPTPAARIRACLPYHLARKLAQVQGGQVEVNDGEGGALSVWFTLPLAS